MRKIRVLVVDDSVIIRRTLVELLSDDPEVEVVGTASNGLIALMNLSNLNPDVITLDVEMPEMDGLQTLTAIRQKYPKLPVIMFSSRTGPGATATIEALMLGATDYVTKPTDAESPAAAIRRVRDELIPKIKAVCPPAARVPEPARPVSTTGAELFTDRQHSSGRETPAGALRDLESTGRTERGRPSRAESEEEGRRARVEIVAIALSTGGPNALEIVLSAIPAGFPIPIVIVQHMPSVFTRLLAERLATRCAVAVREAVNGEPLLPGLALIAPGAQHLVVERQGRSVVMRTHTDEPENSCRPSADVLFRSVASVYGAGTLAVVMTGMGQDGLVGTRAVRDAGGAVLAQDEETSVVWGMPGSVVREGLADKVFPLQKLADEIIRRSYIGRPGAT